MLFTLESDSLWKTNNARANLSVYRLHLSMIVLVIELTHMKSDWFDVADKSCITPAVIMLTITWFNLYRSWSESGARCHSRVSSWNLSHCTIYSFTVLRTKRKFGKEIFTVSGRQACDIHKRGTTTLAGRRRRCKFAGSFLIFRIGLPIPTDALRPFIKHYELMSCKTLGSFSP